MKIRFNLIALLLALSLVLFTVSCAIWTNGSEGGTITMSLSPSAKGLGTGTEARVWVYANNVLVPNSATPDGYYSATVSGDSATVTVKDLAPGENYRVIAVAGTPEGGTFKPTAFGTSEVFGIKAGLETSISLTLQGISITVPQQQPSGIVSLAVAGNTIYAAIPSKIYTGTGINALSQTPWATGTKGSINSLNVTADPSPIVLVNTSAGIFYPNGNAVGTTSWGGTPPNVLQSGGLDTLNTYFYQADKEIGGYVGEGNSWNRIKLDIPVAGKPILDLLVWQKDRDIYGYFATRVVGAFRVGSNKIESLKLEDILSGSETSVITFFGENLPLIQAFGYISGKPDLYLGTKNGVYVTNIETPKSTVPTLIAGTKGLNVTKIVVQGSVEAFLSANELVLLKANKIYKMPFLKSVVGSLSDVAWQGTNLIVAGDKGICSIDTLSIGEGANQ
ncbi:MAG: hypothetical protein N2442_09420 [Spirochaetes bacterium]|nr:hypothetical protein [Spirochaetota bacterium]